MARRTRCDTMFALHLRSLISSRDTGTVSQQALLGVLILAASALYFLGFNSFQVGTYMDDAHYLVAARALGTGHGYSLSILSGSPPELRYPPGWPLLLVPVVQAFPNSLAAPKALSLALTVASLPLWHRVLCRRLPMTLAYLALAAVATNGLVVGLAAQVMSEAGFSFFVASLFVLTDGWTERESSASAHTLAVSGTLIALYFIRTV